MSPAGKRVMAWDERISADENVPEGFPLHSSNQCPRSSDRLDSQIGYSEDNAHVGLDSREDV